VKIRANGGFSLIEMLVVCALLGIMAAVATPSFITYQQNSNLKEAARDLASDINYWRQRAVAEQVRYRIIFNQATNSYTIQIESPANTGNYINLPANATKTPNSISSSIIISNVNLPNQWITFQPRGTLDASGSVTLQHNIRLSTANINTYFTGRVVNVAYNIL
jgi:prepilin-type N-terminal cleavage/methylation domain-containing protein